MIQETSIEAYHSIEEDLGKMQRDVIVGLIQIGAGSNTDIAKYLNRSINTITPRMIELREKRLVTFSRYKICPYTGRRVIEWRPTIIAHKLLNIVK